MRDGRALVLVAVVWALAAGVGRAQERAAPTLRAGDLSEDVRIDGRLDELPYFSRRIGLVGGEQVPIIAGAKVNRLRLNISPDLSIASYVQCDTDSDSVGVNTRLRWTFTPAADLFVQRVLHVVVVDHRWRRASNQQHGLRHLPRQALR